MDKIKILVVDDHAIMRDGIRALLSLCDDMEIVGEASDGREAVEKAQQLNPDLVIMDIAMQKMDGLEAIRRIKKHQPTIKALVLSQHETRDHILSALKAGASGYVPKKTVGSDLITAIRAVHQEGSFLYPSAATALIDDYLHQPNKTDSYNELTAREREVLKLIAEGHTSRKIAEMLFLSTKTVLGHRNKLMKKLNIHNRTELVRYAMRKGLINSEE